MQYITVADVDAALGSNWTDQNKKARFVSMANAYMTNLNLQGIGINRIPEDVVTAGAELASAAANGDLFAQKTQGAVTTDMAKAGSVEAQTSYAVIDLNSTSAQPESIQYALSLLKPYLPSAYSFCVGRRY